MDENCTVLLIMVVSVFLGGVVVPLILNWLMDREVGWKEKIIIAICVILTEIGLWWMLI